MVPSGALGAGELRLTEDVARHVARVLRREPGDALEMTDGEGRFAPATVLRASRDEVVVRVGAVRRVRSRGPHLVLLQGMAKGEKVDRVVRQATELGVAQIRLIQCARSVPGGTGRLDRWRAIAEDAVRVSGRAFRPRIFGAVPLVAALSTLDCELCITLTPDVDVGLRERLKGRSRAATAAVIVGPEGGLTRDEVAVAERSGFWPVHLGDRVMRTETAGAAALAVLQCALGGFERRAGDRDSG